MLCTLASLAQAHRRCVFGSSLRTCRCAPVGGARRALCDRGGHVSEPGMAAAASGVRLLLYPWQLQPRKELPSQGAAWHAP